MLRYILFILLLINMQYLYSQNNNIEFKKFSDKLAKYEVVDSAFVFLEKTIKNTNNKRVLLKANFTLGRAYKVHKKNYLLSKKYLRKAEPFAKKLHDDGKLANIYLYYGIILHHNESDSALYYYNKALDISQKIKNYNIISKTYSNIARLYRKEKDNKSAILFYHKSIAIGKKAKRNLCTVYNNMGVLYEEKNRDSAIYYHAESLKLAKKDSIKKYELRSYVNLGNLYLEDPNTYDAAYKILTDRKEKAKKSQDIRFLYYINFYLGNYYQKTGKLDKAEIHYNLALDSEASKKFSDQQIIVLKQISNFYEELGDYKKANIFQKQYHYLKDSIYSIEKNNAFNKIRTQHKVAKKDNEITLLTKEKEIEGAKNKSVILISIIILTILLFFTYLLKNRIKMQKVLREKEHKSFLQEIKTKKALSLIEGQDKERKRLSEELHDGLGGQLSGIKSMMQAITDTNFIDKKKTIDKHLASSIKTLRSISHDLSGNFIQKKDFDILIQQLVSRVFISQKIETEVSIFPAQKLNELPEHYKLNIYRIIQESTQNIIKHANATYVSISVLLDTEISILIQDNGVGFDTAKKQNGIGLQNIKDRLQSINGTLYIDSQLKKGTTININIPIHD